MADSAHREDGESSTSRDGAGRAEKERASLENYWLLLDDLEIHREELRHRADELEEAHSALDGESAIELARLLTPDVVIMDVTISGVGGIEATRRISSEHPESRVVGLSMHESDEVALAMRTAGAFEYLLKSSPPHRLLETIRRAAFDARRDPS